MKSLSLPEMDYAFTQRVIQAFILAESEKYRFKGAVIALSGGLDSCLTAFLAHQALNGKISLIYMPYGEHPSSQKDAQALAEFLQTPMEHFDIKTTADSLFQGRNIQDPKRRGNVLARLRMNLLFDLSARDHLMVVGTSNKSEMLTGYSTWYGDSAAGIMPLGDLYKTQVRALSAYCQLPESILRKAPSAELWEGQTDEGEMGISYPNWMLYCIIGLICVTVPKNSFKWALMSCLFKKQYLWHAKHCSNTNCPSSASFPIALLAWIIA